MDGNSAKKAPVLDHLMSTHQAPTSHPVSTAPSASNGAALKMGIPAQPVHRQGRQQTNPADNTHNESPPQNRHTDKSQFEIELTHTVNQIMLKHFEHASEQIVQQVLNEVRARLPGQKKD